MVVDGTEISDVEGLLIMVMLLHLNPEHIKDRALVYAESAENKSIKKAFIDIAKSSDPIELVRKNQDIFLKKAELDIKKSESGNVVKYKLSKKVASQFFTSTR